MYEERFGLTGLPFQTTPDPRFTFETAAHRKAMAYLGYGLAQGEGLVVVTGEPGVGKTTLMGRLLDGVDRSRLNPMAVPSGAIEMDGLFHIVARELGARPEGSTETLALPTIGSALNDVARSGRRTLLIVDEAQALTVSALEALGDLSHLRSEDGRTLVQIILLGRPELRDRLHGEARLEPLRRRVVAFHHLQPMGEGEIADYVAHRLTVVGWRGRPDFAEDAFPALHRGSGGVPRRLNRLAGHAMAHAAAHGLELIDARVVEAVMADTPPSASEPQREADAQAPIRPAAPDAAAERRIAMLEHRLEMQEVALKRVLTLLIEWVEGDLATPGRAATRDRAA